MYVVVVMAFILEANICWAFHKVLSGLFIDGQEFVPLLFFETFLLFSQVSCVVLMLSLAYYVCM